MDFFSILTMIGGLALFLYGMHVLGEGLSKASGGRMEQILEKLTSGKWKAVLLGAGVTAVIQSSSATTVMVVGFVNSGIMKLSNAIGVIMGANVGTTVTSWLLSLTGIESSNFFVQLLKPTSFSPILAIIGVGFLLFSKKDKYKNVAIIMIGFAVLMFGMETMSSAVKPLADVPEFRNLLLVFSNPVLGMIAGLVLTAIIQSSSASVGILQALCATGSVSYGTALPIIMGQNIGTCVTALLSAVGTSKNAKRAAIIHLYFNLIGTIVFMIVFYTLNAVIGFAFMDAAAQPFGIAVIHSVFNLFATCLLLPFSRLLEKLAYMTIKEDPSEYVRARYIDEDIKVLDSRFMNNPALAMEQCRRVISHMADTAQESYNKAVSLLGGYVEEVAEGVIQMEEDVDRYEDVLGTYLLKLTGRELSERDSQSLTLYLQSIGDFERISDHAVSIAKACEEMWRKEMQFSNKAQEELEIFTRAIQQIISTSLKVFRDEDTALSYEVEALQAVVEDLSVEVRKRHVKRLRKGKCTIELGFLLSDIVTSYERIAAHCMHIAVNMVQVREDSLEMHGYHAEIKERDTEKYRHLYESYIQEYALPEKEKNKKNAENR
ncbi:MAG: Na/Pi cotransporter family protein [Lachnospiraceae bacterium]|nr:Na/Pi cotransporter family protein [Lachnospiraceae bacterium]